MSKIGRQAIPLRGVKAEIKGQEVHYSGKHAAGVHVLPAQLTVTLENDSLKVSVDSSDDRKTRMLWGLHRVLLANKIAGARDLFQKQVQITGLGYKAIAKGASLEFTLGYSHKIDVAIPKGITVEIDKVGQLLTFKSADNELLGKVCGDLRSLKPTEPYKGTGVRLVTDVIIRKAGKTKGA